MVVVVVTEVSGVVLVDPLVGRMGAVALAVEVGRSGQCVPVLQPCPLGQHPPPSDDGQEKKPVVQLEAETAVDEGDVVGDTSTVVGCTTVVVTVPPPPAMMMVSVVVSSDG